MSKDLIRITVELSQDQAWKYSNFLKRVEFNCYSGFFRKSDTETPYIMMDAVDRIQ